MKFKEYIGKVVGPFRVLGIAYLDEYQQAVFKCSCLKCHRICEKRYTNLRKVKSCGCIRRRTHDAAFTPEYKVWTQMIQRCHNTKAVGYYNYGARGIKVYGPWRNSFQTFIDCVGWRPTKKHTIERIDSNKGYVPGNVKWATYSEQNRNRRGNHKVTYKGRTQVVCDLAAELGMSPVTLFHRLKRWSVHKSMTHPVTERGRRIWCRRNGVRVATRKSVSVNQL